MITGRMRRMATKMIGTKMMNQMKTPAPSPSPLETMPLMEAMVNKMVGPVVQQVHNIGERIERLASMPVAPPPPPPPN